MKKRRRTGQGILGITHIRATGMKTQQRSRL